MDYLEPRFRLSHERRGCQNLYRMPNGLGASVVPYAPPAERMPGTVDVLIVEWTGDGPDDYTDHVPADWSAIEDFIAKVESQGGDVYLGSGGCELQCVPEHELLGLLQLIAGLR